MTRLVQTIKDIFRKFQGSLSTDKDSFHEIDEELKYLYIKVYGDLNMSQTYEDKINLHNDQIKLKKDFKKAIKKYKEVVVNG